MSNTNKIKGTIKNLTEKYDKTSWKDILSAMFKTEEFNIALNQLISDHQAGQPFTPVIKDIFKSYDLCPLEDIKVVFITQYPVLSEGKASGLAFSGVENPFYMSLKSKEDGKLNNFDLSYLPKEQGVMLLNAAITCPIGKLEDHLPMWAPLTEKLIKAISYRTLKTIFIFVGKDVEHLKKQVGKGHLKFFMPDVLESKSWDHNNLFDKVNKALIKLKKTPITW